MLAIRSALFLLFEIVTVVPFALLCLLWSPLPRRLRYRLTVAWPRMVIHAGRILCGMRWQVRGMENLPDEPVILLSKHQSTWETLFYPATLPREAIQAGGRPEITAAPSMAATTNVRTAASMSKVIQ